MIQETILMVQTCDLKVEINCNGCVKKIKNIVQKIDGVYQTNVNRQQGKVTVTGLMDIDTVVKKLKKARISAQLWDANSAAVSKDQKLQLDASDGGDKLKDAGVKSLPQGEASNNGGGTNDATMVLPQPTLTPTPTPTPTPEQHVPNIQEQIEQRLQMLNGGKQLPPHLMGTSPAINMGGKQSGKKIGGGTKVLVPGNGDNGNKNDMGTKLYQDAGGSQVKNGAIGQPLHNGALGSLNNRSQAKKNISVGVGSHMMGGSMAPQKGGMMRPTNNMIGPTSFPIVGQMGGMSMGPYTNLDGHNMQPYGGRAVHGLGMPASTLPSGAASSSRPEMMQQAARNPMPQQPYMPVPQQPYMMLQPQQEHEMMKNAHYPHNQNAHYGPSITGYQLMGYDNGHGHLQQEYPPPMYYPMPPLPQHDNTFSDDNPNICSLM